MTSNYSIGKKVAFLAICVFLVQSCDSNVTPADPLSESFLIENIRSQEALIMTLRERGVNFRTDEENQIWFLPSDRKAVHAAASEIMSSSRPTRQSFRYPDPKYTDLLIDELRKKNIPFLIEVIGGEKHILLEEKDANLWAPVKREIDAIYDNEITQTLMKKHE